MLRRISRASLALVAAATLTLPAVAIASDPGAAERLRAQRWGEITRIDGGLLFRASQHDSRLVVTRDGARVRFHDRALRRWLSIPRGCRRVAVETGIAASCRVPDTTTPADPMLLEIVPRLGDDRIDASALGAEFQLTVLADAGHDVVFGGAGNDYVNGAFGVDRVHGGAGKDFIRSGGAADIVDGGTGDDRLVGLESDDWLSGNEGDDRLEGGVGNDTLLGGPGSDVLLCGDGNDTSDDNTPDDDAARHCEGTIP